MYLYFDFKLRKLGVMMKKYINVLLSIFLLFTVVLPLCADNTVDDRLVELVRKKSFLTAQDVNVWIQPKKIMMILQPLAPLALSGPLIGAAMLAYKIENIFPDSSDLIKNFRFLSIMTSGLLLTSILLPPLPKGYRPPWKRRLYSFVDDLLYKNTREDMYAKVIKYNHLCWYLPLAKKNFNSANLSNESKIASLKQALKDSQWCLDYNKIEKESVIKALDEIYKQGGYALQLIERLDKPVGLFDYNDEEKKKQDMPRSLEPHSLKDLRDWISEDMNNIKLNKELIEKIL